MDNLKYFVTNIDILHPYKKTIHTGVLRLKKIISTVR